MPRWFTFLVTTLGVFAFLFFVCVDPTIDLLRTFSTESECSGGRCSAFGNALVNGDAEVAVKAIFGLAAIGLGLLAAERTARRAPASLKTPEKPAG